MKPQISTRPVMPDDVTELCKLLNEIIRAGGTTAIATPLSNVQFKSYYLTGEGHLSCIAAVDNAGCLAGFQALEYSPKLPEGWADIATFARMKPKIPGVGTALFTDSRQIAVQSGIIALNATIRADNKAGLKYYDKMGFCTYAVQKSVPLKDGTAVDRISKRFDIR